MLSRHLILIVLAVAARTFGAEAGRQPWSILKEEIGRGSDEEIALGVLGEIGDSESRSLIESILRGKDYTRISFVATGLTPRQCALYLADLGRAARETGNRPNSFSVLTAIARAGNTEAAGLLAELSDSAGLPTAGVALGLLEKMGRVAEPSLMMIVTGGRTPWSRETAAWSLIRMGARSSIGALRSALRDSDERVRAAGAEGLAHFGDPEGKAQLEAIANHAQSGSSDQIAAVIGLVLLGQPDAYEILKKLVTAPDETVRGRAVWAMAWSGARTIKDFAYRQGLDRQPVFRSMLAEKLLDPADTRDMTVLQSMLASGDEMSQLVAAQRILVSRADQNAEKAVANALGSASDAVRSVALRIASESGAMRVELAKKLSSPDPAVKVAALTAISELHQQSRLLEVAQYLTSQYPSVSAAAARALVALDQEAAKPILRQGLDSSTAHVRIYSAAMLLSISGRAPETQRPEGVK